MEPEGDGKTVLTPSALPGLSGLDFVHGFSRNATLDMTITHHRPIKGKSFPLKLMYNVTLKS